MADTHVNGSADGPAASHSPGRDLPPELVAAGWRKFYSKREQRHYYFNKFTNQSLWDEPTMGVSFLILDDISFCEVHNCNDTMKCLTFFKQCLQYTLVDIDVAVFVDISTRLHIFPILL